MISFMKRLWKNKFVWQVWIRIFAFLLCTPLILIASIGDGCNSVIDTIQDALPDFEEKK